MEANFGKKFRREPTSKDGVETQCIWIIFAMELFPDDLPSRINGDSWCSKYVQ